MQDSKMGNWKADMMKKRDEMMNNMKTVGPNAKKCPKCGGDLVNSKEVSGAGTTKVCSKCGAQYGVEF